MKESMMTESETTPLKGEDIVVYVPPGSAKNVKVVENDPKPRGQDITIQVSRHRKPKLSRAVGVIVK
jgi:hypothetical protein